MAKKNESFLILTDGTKHKIVKEDNRFFYCKKAQFKKNSKQIEKVSREERKETDDEVTEEATADNVGREVDDA